MNVLRVDDFTSFNPFEDASNWSSAIFVQRDRETAFPVPYYIWSLKDGVSPKDITPERFDSQLTVSEEEARPVDAFKPSSPWITTSPRRHSALKSVLGRSAYKGYAGMTTWLDGVFWVNIIRDMGDYVLVENLPELAKTELPKVQVRIEKLLVYPFLEWDKIRRFFAPPTHHVIVPQDPETRAGFDYAWMRRHAPKTLEYLRRFEEPLRKRSGFRRYFKDSDPFYSVYNVGSHTFAKTRTIYRTMGSDIRAAVLSPVKDPVLGVRPVVHKNTTISIPVGSLDEAHYVCAVLNSSVVTEVANAYAVKGGKSFGSTNLLNYVKIPAFNEGVPEHRQLAECSRRAHEQVTAGRESELRVIGKRIDSLAERLW